MRFNTLQDWLRWQESCHPRDIDLGLARVAEVARRIALNLDNCLVVTVAGTNGKGSCVAALSALLKTANLRVGSFTSPHLLRYNERVVLNGQPVVDQLLIDSFDRIDQARGDISLTYFEFGALAAIDIFQAADLDVAILEVGLGGRLDAVNIIDADIAIVTSVDIDHQDWLGNDREQIGREKAGVFRSGRPAISAGLQPPQSLREEAERINAEFYQAGEGFSYRLNGEGRWCWQSGDYKFTTPSPQLPPESIAAAIKAIRLLPIDSNKIDFEVLATIELAGRFQQFEVGGKQVIVDVAHNPAAASYLAQRLANQACAGRTFALIAVMQDKDLAGVLSALDSAVDRWCLAELPDNPRAMAANTLADYCRAGNIADFSAMGTVSEAFAEVLSRLQSGDRLVVLGSFYTVAEVLALRELINE